MIKENTLISGNKQELIEYFYKLTKNTEHMTAAGNLLYSEKGLKSQLNNISNEPGMFGLIFYIISKSENDLELKSCYVYIKE